MSEKKNESDLQHECLIQIFKRYLNQDPLVIKAIIKFKKSFRLDNNCWFFTQPDLFDFCHQLSTEISSLEYQNFRRLLYHYPTNQMISTDQGLFELEEDRGHIDKNIYALKRQLQKNL